MAKVSIEEAKKDLGNSTFFSIKNDAESKDVRFLYKDVSQIDTYSLHAVKVNGKHRWVDCLKDPSNPDSVCPFCENGVKKDARAFVLVYDVNEESAKIWERSINWVDRTLIPTLKCVNSEEVVGTTFKITRSGKPGDVNTTYILILTGTDDIKMEDFQDDLPETDAIILKKSAEEMEYYLENGEFPETTESKTEKKGFKKSGTREVEANASNKPTIGRRNRF